jgi:hypothetical protein
MAARSKAAKAWIDKAREVLTTQRNCVEAMKLVVEKGKKICKMIKVLEATMPPRLLLYAHGMRKLRSVYILKFSL